MNKRWATLSAHERALLEAHAEPVVAVRPKIVRALKGNGNAAILLSQLLYWTQNSRRIDTEGWFFNTQEELEKQTGLGCDGQLSARKVLVKRGLLEEERRGVPAQLYFRLNLQTVYSLFVGIAVLSPDSAQAPNLEAGQAPPQDSAQAPNLIDKDKKIISKTKVEITHTHGAPAPSSSSNGNGSKNVCVSQSKFTYEERKRYAANNRDCNGELLGAGWIKASRDGSCDEMIEDWYRQQEQPLSSQPNRDTSCCPDCKGSGMYFPAGDTPEGRLQGAAKCKHPRLDEELERLQQAYDAAQQEMRAGASSSQL